MEAGKEIDNDGGNIYNDSGSRRSPLQDDAPLNPAQDQQPPFALLAATAGTPLASNLGGRGPEIPPVMTLESEDGDDDFAGKNISMPPSLDDSYIGSTIKQRGSSSDMVTPTPSFSFDDPMKVPPAGLAPCSPFRRDSALSPRGGTGGRTRITASPSPSPNQPRKSLTQRRKSSRMSLLSPSAAAASTSGRNSLVGAQPALPSIENLGGAADGQVNELNGLPTAPKQTEHDHPLIATLCYRGYEVIFASTTEYAKEEDSPDRQHMTKHVRRDGLQVLHARTRLPAFVSLRDRATNNGATQGWIGIPPSAGHLVALQVNNSTGNVAAVTSRGLILLLVPSNCSVRRYTHGKYVWNVEAVWDVTDVFVNPASPSRGTSGDPSAQEHFFQRRNPAVDHNKAGTRFDNTDGSTNHIIDISLSFDDKLLLAFRDQLAVLDMSGWEIRAQALAKSSMMGQLPPIMVDVNAEGATSFNSTGTGTTPTTQNAHPTMAYSSAFTNIKSANRVIAWTKKLSSPIIQADMSGDGGAIACVLESVASENPRPRYGVHTFIHDGNDGGGGGGVSASVSMGGLPMDEATLKITAEKRQLLKRSSSLVARSKLRRGGSIGIIYRAMAFLDHAAPVTSIMWRHEGYTMSSCNPVEHNDLLLTHCASDSSFRVFSQSQIENVAESSPPATSSPNPVLHWMAPPYSVATWVDGISLANMGDLTDPKTGAISNEDIAMGSSESLQKASSTAHQNASLMHNAVMNQTGSQGPGGGGPVVPTTAAGAWICEVTFRGSFPALRLSRLSFVRGTNKGSDEGANPAHFESVAVLLPPGILPGLESLSLSKKEPPNHILRNVLQMSVQGVWSGWDLPPPSSSTHHEKWMGGSHAPPSELRLVASHAAWGRNRVTVLDFPLWGEADLGVNVEFGTPIRHFLSLLHDTTDTSTITAARSKRETQMLAKINDVSNRQAVWRMPAATLLARVHESALHGSSIRLEYRQEASQSLIPLCHGTYDSTFLPGNGAGGAAVSTGSGTSICSDLSGAYIEWDDYDASDAHGGEKRTRSLQRYIDSSAVPLPLLLPSLFPYDAGHGRGRNRSSHPHPRGKDAIRAIHWWPKSAYRSPYPGGESTSAEESYILMALTEQGSLVVYEVPPPYSATEPAMPTSYDPNHPPHSNLASLQSTSLDGGVVVGGGEGAGASLTGGSSWQGGATASASFGALGGSQMQRCEYEVNITPHTDFGIGLRLESRSMPYHPQTNEVAIAGSFKKHPLSGSRLPAEKSGLIVIGDVLVGVNGVDLSCKTFDEVIDTVRHESSIVAREKCPLKLKFKPFELFPTSADSVAGRGVVGGSVGGRSVRSGRSHSSSVMAQQAFQTTPHVPDNVVVTTTLSKDTAGSSKGERRTIDEILGIQPSLSRDDLILSPSPSRTSSRIRLNISDGDELVGIPHLGDETDDEESESASGATVQVGAEAETQQEFGRVIGVCRLVDENAGKMAKPDNPANGAISCSTVLPFQYVSSETGSLSAPSSCALVYARGNHIVAAHIELSDASALLLLPEENSSCHFLASCELFKEGDNNRKRSVVSMETIHFPGGASNGCVAVLDSEGTVHLMLLSQTTAKDTSFKFQTFVACRCSCPPGKILSNFQLRASSLDLFATLCHVRDDGDDSSKPACNKSSGQITVWRAWPHLATEDKKGSTGEGPSSPKSTENEDPLYHAFEIKLPFPPMHEETVRDMEWMTAPSPTALNTSPLLVVWTTSRAIVYKCTSRSEWLNIIDVQYSETFCGDGANPATLWPHLRTGLYSLSSNTLPNDKKNELNANASKNEDTHVRLAPDWHPDSIIASICCDSKGVQHSMRKRKKGLPNGSFASSVIHWLAKWTSPDETERPMLGNHVWANNGDLNDHQSNPGMGNVVPYTALHAGNNTATYGRNEDSDDEEEALVENADNLMALLISAPKTVTISTAEKATMSEAEMLLLELAESIEKYVYAHEKISKGSTKKRKAVVSLANKRGASVEDEGDKLVLPTMPKPLRTFTVEELICLRSLIGMYCDPPSLKTLDAPGQLALFAMELTRTVTETYDNTDEAKVKAKEEEASAAAPKVLVNPLDVQTKRSITACAFSSQWGQENVVTTPISSGAALAALLSNTQVDLLSNCRAKLTLPNQKMNWTTARRLLIPFWLRDMDALKRVSEDIALNMFKETRDVMECALLFVAMRKIPTLTNLARTDDSISGRTFMKFLINHNFSSPKGRSAAEKNAYSLLRKRRYGVAAAFFLLAEPPLMSTALEVIIGNMNDPQLALLVSRLIEDARSGASGPGGINFSKLGGGGGFATIGAPVLDDAPEEEPFEKWNPKLGDIALKKLKVGAIPKATAKGDFAMVAMLNLWIGDRTEAFRCMVDPKTSDGGLLGPFGGDDVKGPDKGAAMAATSNCDKPNPSIIRLQQVLTCLNSRIDHGSRFLLLHSLRAPKRAQWCAALQIARGLSARGIELPCLDLLIQAKDIALKEESAKVPSTTDAQSAPKYATSSSIFDPSSNTASSVASSSIFDDFDAPSTRPKKPSAGAPLPGPSSGQMSSSIFDNFDAPRPQPKKASAAASGEMSSSIFDNFDAPRPAPKKAPAQAAAASSGEMSSSIFDNFDAPRPAPKKAPVQAAAASSGEMSSSIFDNFDAPRPAPKKAPTPAPAPTSGEMSSSIFDNFDAPRLAPKKAVPASGEMSSSIFDNFDAPRPAPKKAPAKAAAPASGAMSSSIFDNFDAPRPPAKKEPARVPSIFDSFDDPRGANRGGRQNGGSGKPANKEPEPLFVEKIVKEMPQLWDAWRTSYLTRSVARRLLREISRVCGLFYGDLPDPQLSAFRRSGSTLVPHGAAEVVQHQCDIDVVSGMKECLAGLCGQSQLPSALVVEDALNLLQSESCSGMLPAYSILFQVILHLINDRKKLAEVVVSEAAKRQFLLCEAISVSNDDFRFKRRTKFHMCSQTMRRQACQVSWQLELCLWLYRGGNLPLSSCVMKDAITGARVGILVSAWGRCHETLENVVKCEPDCVSEYELGRQLWTSWKMMSGERETTNNKTTKSSGGWEFLVDCKRSESTEMLKSKRTGTFLLRPHPEDHGVFTLSFKTNLVPTAPKEDTPDKPKSKKGVSPKAKVISPDDVVQHAIVRLSDAGFRCGSFGPFGSLIKLLEAVSSSLPFGLLFDAPPSEGIIKDQGEQPSPNSFLFRKLSLHSKTQRYTWNSSHNLAILGGGNSSDEEECDADNRYDAAEKTLVVKESRNETKKRFGLFIQLLAMSEVTRQICAVFGAEYEEEKLSRRSSKIGQDGFLAGYEESEFDDENDTYTMSIRTLRPLIEWRRTLEVQVLREVAPELSAILETIASLPVAVDASDSGIEALPSEAGSFTVVTGGDAVIRRMIQAGSGVHFHSLRVGEGGHSGMVVLFKRDEAIPWIVSSGTEKDQKDAVSRLNWMEKRRVIEVVDLEELMALWHGKPLKRDEGEEPKNLRYRFIDPWEVQPLETREAECEEAILGRESYVPFSVLTVAQSCEHMLRAIGGIHLLSLWNTAKGGIFLTKAIASVLPPWERDAGADLNTSEGASDEPPPLISNIRRHLYRNHIFRRLRLPQRFLALVQVEMLDLKNLTSPGGTSTISAYCLLRLHRKGASAPLSHKAKPLDSCTTEPKKIGKSSGPNAPASWGTVVRFRFPLPEDVDCDGVSHDIDRETLFKGPPNVLQVAVYEKKFISDMLLGTADISLDGLNCNGGLEEWVPLKKGKSGITWFTRIRISLRFELMCLNCGDASIQASPLSPMSTISESDPDVHVNRSVGLQKIYELCHSGGAHEDGKSMRHSESTPDFFGSMF
jgi:hypothetical protein